LQLVPVSSERRGLIRLGMSRVVLSLGLLLACTSCSSADTEPPPEGMVSVPASGSSYAIDATEVTASAYAAFLAESPTSAGQSASCATNDSFVPAGEWPQQGDGQLPVVNVDYCDAVAYCKWAGKHLCGMRGTVADPHEAYNDEEKNEWYRACSAAETRLYPYGGNPFDPSEIKNAYRPDACNGKDKGIGAPIAVGTLPGCEGGHPGLFDMSGNVSEWSDDCDQGQCAVRGGSFQHAGPAGFISMLDCTATTYDSPDTSRADLGFRCCK